MELLRAERALVMLDSGLKGSGMRLAVRTDRIVVVGRLDRTELAGRLSLERLSAGELDPKLARFLWVTLEGIGPEKIEIARFATSLTAWACTNKDPHQRAVEFSKPVTQWIQQQRVAPAGRVGESGPVTGHLGTSPRTRWA